MILLRNDDIWKCWLKINIEIKDKDLIRNRMLNNMGVLIEVIKFRKIKLGII